MTPLQHAEALVFEERIEQLIDYRHWYRRLLTPTLRPYFSPMLAEWTAELRALLVLRRRARNIARQAEVQRTAAIDSGVGTWESIPKFDIQTVVGTEPYGPTWTDDMGRIVTFGGRAR